MSAAEELDRCVQRMPSLVAPTALGSERAKTTSSYRSPRCRSSAQATGGYMRCRLADQLYVIEYRNTPLHTETA